MHCCLRIGGYYWHSYRSIGVMASTWCLVIAFFLVNIYSSCLTSYTSLTFQRPNVSSFSDLATKPNYQVMALVKGTTPDNTFSVYFTHANVTKLFHRNLL